MLIVNSEKCHRYQKKYTATAFKNQATPAQYDIFYNHQKSEIFLRTYAGEIRMLYEIFLAEMYPLPGAVSFSNGVIVEAGANAGITALYFSSIFPTATIFCIEPAAMNISVLKMNLASAISSGKAHIIEAALYKKDQDVYLNNSGWAYNASMNEAGEIGTAIAMNTFVEKNTLEKIDLLKAGIEGAENFIFFHIRKGHRK
ncbi:MAG: FkbM family methyltransferase [Bacteroidota bacterium]